MELTYRKYDLELIQEFTISNYSRKFTPTVLVELHQDGVTGYGEASMPQYLKENQDTVIQWLSNVKLKNIYSYDDLVDTLTDLNDRAIKNYPAIAAIDIALHDLLGKLLNVPCYKFYGIIPKNDLFTSFTIGLADEKTLISKIHAADKYKILKIKLGAENDKQIIDTIRKITDQKLFVDANQGWKDKYFALDMINWLSDKNAILVEQPMPVANYEDTAWLKNRVSLPLIADEAFQTVDNLDKIKDCYSGINIKLMKCGGIYNAYNIVQKAKKNNLKVMLGCMTETSCGISAAKILSPLADYLDLDGNLLIQNDPFGNEINSEGKLVINNLPGLGINKVEK
ncbi:MAG: dipeptide epimerase [Bacteroidota bacterium]